jgi:hypothetical protein
MSALEPQVGMLSLSLPRHRIMIKVRGFCFLSSHTASGSFTDSWCISWRKEGRKKNHQTWDLLLLFFGNSMKTLILALSVHFFSSRIIIRIRNFCFLSSYTASGSFLDSWCILWRKEGRKAEESSDLRSFTVVLLSDFHGNPNSLRVEIWCFSKVFHLEIGKIYSFCWKLFVKQKTSLHEFLMYFMKEEQEEEALDSTLLFVLLE